MAILPNAFTEHYRRVLGDKEAALFFEYCQKPLRKSFRINTLKTTKEVFFQMHLPKEWNIEQVPWCETGFFLAREDVSLPIGNMPEHSLGLIYIQEASSMIPVEALFYGNETTDFSNCIIGDIAASPGSKTTHMACKLQGKGTIVANELSASRLKALYSNLERCGVQNTILTHYDGENLCSCVPEIFDFLLLDAPCTGEGTVRKNFDALKNWNIADAKTMSQLQKKLLVAAFHSLKEGGELVYSTCTLGREENQEVIEYLQSLYKEYLEIIPLNHLFPGVEKCITSEGFLHVFPHIYDTEGFFVAKIKKIKSTHTQMRSSILKNFPFIRLSLKEKQKIKMIIGNQWGIDFSEAYLSQLWKRGDEVWLLPQAIQTIASLVRSNRAGVHIGTWYGDQWKTTHEFMSCFGKSFTKNIYPIDRKALQKILHGENIEISSLSQKGELCMCYKDIPVAIGKMQNETWKNNIPRVLLR